MKIVNISRKYRMPIVPYSGGTSLEGHNRGVRPAISHASRTVFENGHKHASGGICVDMSGMDRIIEIHGKDTDSMAVSTAHFEPAPV